MDLAYVDKLVKDNNGVKYLLVRQHLFDRTIYAKGLRTRDFKKTIRRVLTMITEMNRTRKNLVGNGTELAGIFIKLCKFEGIQIYVTMSETKAAFPECTIRSLKIKVYRYIEGHGYKYIQKMTHFVANLNSIKILSDNLGTKEV